MTHPDNFLYSYCINNYRVFPMIGNNFDVGFVITKVSVKIP